MKKDDSTFRYFQNIASYSARPEIHLSHDGINAKYWRPEYIDYNIDINKKWTNFKEKPKEFKTINLSNLKTLFAFDNSGSISENSIYFDEIDNLVKKYYKEGDKFYLWGSSFQEKSKTEIDSWIKNKRGVEGTDSSLIAKLAIECPNHREHLIIVTDGYVGENDIKRCDEIIINNKIKFKFVSIYLIGKGGNLSVGAPFCRCSPNRTFLIIDIYHHRIKGPSLSLYGLSLYNQITNITSIEQFNNLYDKLYSVIKAKTLGRIEDKELKNKLDILKSKILINNLSWQQREDFYIKFENLYRMSSSGFHCYAVVEK